MGQTWNVLLNILILDVLSLTAYSPSDDQTNSSAEPKDLFLQAKAVYIMYSPSPQTTTNLPLGLCFKLWYQKYIYILTPSFWWTSNLNEARKWIIVVLLLAKSVTACSQKDHCNIFQTRMNNYKSNRLNLCWPGSQSELISDVVDQ